MLDREIATLQRTALLSTMEREALRLLAFGAERRSLRARDVLFQEGEASTGAFLLTAGTLRLRDAAGRSVELGPGALIGESSLFAPTKRPGTARAQTDAAVLFLSRALMRRVLAEFPNSAVKVRAVLAARLRATLDGLGAIAPAFADPEPKPAQPAEPAGGAPEPAPEHPPGG